LAEMFYLTEEIPAKVSINESVEVAKAFWDDSAKKIVNGLLHSVFKDYEELKEFAKQPQETQKYSVLKKSL
jgi:N utilization substance protein B